MGQVKETTMLIPLKTVIGQSQAKKFLQRSCERDRTGHAYLFRGPAGVGKKTLAMSFAAYINCLEPSGGDVCGHCSSCSKYASGNHPDLQHIEPEGAAIKISQIRELKKNITYPPFEASYRVILIPDVHATMRRKEVANSLLKILEEPPPQNIFILTGDEAGEILPTILSRCQIVPFYSLDYGDLADELQKDGVERETASTLAAVAEGSLGRARQFLQHDLLPLRRRIVEQLLYLSPTHPDSIEVVFQLAEETAGLKENIDEILDLLSIWIRDVILAEKGLVEQVISRDVSDLLPAAVQRWSIEQLTGQLSSISNARKYLQSNCTRTLVCEVLFFDML